MNSMIIDNPPDLPPGAPSAICAFGVQVEDHIEHALDLNRYLIKHPAATFFIRADGDAMRDLGILDGDLLVVDRALAPQNNSIVLAVLNGEFTVKRLQINAGKMFLHSANRQQKPIPMSESNKVQLWGVVTHAIHDVRPG